MLLLWHVSENKTQKNCRWQHYGAQPWKYKILPLFKIPRAVCSTAVFQCMLEYKWVNCQTNIIIDLFAWVGVGAVAHHL